MGLQQDIVGLRSVDPVMRQRVFEFAVANPHIAYTTD
jgi:hypothetical protein